MPRSKPLAASTIKKELGKLRGALKVPGPVEPEAATGAIAALEWVGGEGSPPMTRLMVAARPRVRPSVDPLPIPPGWIPDAYVSPTGGTGTGSIIDPWSLANFCSGAGGGVIPGLKVSMRAGTYTGSFTSVVNGNAANPIILRQHPGEHATINGPLAANGSYTRFWGFESTSPTPNGTEANGIQSRGEGNKLINLLVHDHPGTGVTLFDSDHLPAGVAKPDQEAYGLISYNNGKAGTPGSHGIYAWNRAGYRKIRDGIYLNNWDYGIHAYSADDELHDVTLEGNIVANNGSISGSPVTGDLLLGGSGGPITGAVVKHNGVYRLADSGAVMVGYYYHDANTDLIYTDNYTYGLVELFDWATAEVTRNTAVLNSLNANIVDGYVVFVRGAWATRGVVSGHAVSANTWYAPDATDNLWGYGPAGEPNPVYPGGSKSFAAWKTATGFTGPGSVVTGTPPNKIMVRPNEYEPGRGHIGIWNWDLSSSVSVDLSSILSAGQVYEILNAQAYYGTPAVAASVYTGGSVSIPMAGIAAPVPVDRGVAGPMTGPQFQAFVVRLVGS